MFGDLESNEIKIACEIKDFKLVMIIVKAL